MASSAAIRSGSHTDSKLGPPSIISDRFESMVSLLLAPRSETLCSAIVGRILVLDRFPGIQVQNIILAGAGQETTKNRPAIMAVD